VQRPLVRPVASSTIRFHAYRKATVSSIALTSAYDQRFVSGEPTWRSSSSRSPALVFLP
jgi:hypothetical protein